VVTAAALFGTAGAAQELGPDATTPLGIGVVRIAIGTLVLWAAVGLTRPSVADLVGTVRAMWRPIVIGGFGVAVYAPAFFTAVDRTGVAVGTVVGVGSGPFFAGALESVWRATRPSLGWLIGTLVTVGGGVVLVVAQTGGDSQVDALGIVLALAAGAGYALYSVTSKVTMDAGLAPTAALAAPFTVGAVVVAVLALREPYGWMGSPGGLATAVHLGVLATGVAYVLFGYGLRRLTSATTVTLVLAEPLTASLLAVVVLDEHISPGGFAGIVLVLTGLIVVGRTADLSTGPPVPTGVGAVR
jgi:DME family drug/metabolite transporter